MFRDAPEVAYERDAGKGTVPTMLFQSAPGRFKDCGTTGAAYIHYKVGGKGGGGGC